MKRKIAIISYGLSGGGAERASSVLANNLCKDGNEVFFVATFSPLKEYELLPSIEFYCADAECRNKLTRLFSRAGRIYKFLREKKPEIIISFVINEMFLSALLIKKPIIYTLRTNPEAVMEKKLYKWLCPTLYKHADAIVFQTEGAREYFGEDIKRKGVVIGNPLSSGLPYWRRGEGEKRVITAGRLDEMKDHRMLINAFSVFVKTHPQYKLEIYGEGCLRPALEKQISDLGLNEKVFLPGHSGEIYKILADSAIFVMSSRSEGLSNAMLEALAIGVPTVCTDCPPGGAREYISDGENGMLVPVGDEEAMETKLSALADDFDLCKKLSQNAQQIRERLSGEKIAAAWENVIEQTLVKEN